MIRSNKLRKFERECVNFSTDVFAKKSSKTLPHFLSHNRSLLQYAFFLTVVLLSASFAIAGQSIEHRSVDFNKSSKVKKDRNITNSHDKNHLVESLVVVDPRVVDYQNLIRDIDISTGIHVLDPKKDGVMQVTRLLDQYEALQEVHIVSHGKAGQMMLGSAVLSENNLDFYSRPLQSWGSALKKNGDLLLYGCNIAQGKKGHRFLEKLAIITGVDLAASNDLTGSSEMDGDWVLEVRLGKMERENDIFAGVAQKYQHVLDTMTFDSGASHAGFTFSGFKNDGATIWLTNMNVGATAQITKNTGVFDLTSFQFGDPVNGGGGYTVTSNLGHSASYSDSMPGTLNLNWSGISWIKWEVTTNGTAGDIDNLVFAMDSTPPTISTISIPNAVMKVGDVVTANIIVSSDTDDYTTGSGGMSGVIGGFSLGSLGKVNDTTYAATFSVTNGGTDVAAGSDIPVSVTLTDSSGNTSSAYTNAISQNSDAIDANIPTVTSVGVPADDTYREGTDLDFTVNTSEDVTVSTGGGTPRLYLDIGGVTRYATYLSGSGTSALVFRYTLLGGDLDSNGIGLGIYSLTANGGTLRDAGGNDLNTTLNAIGSTSGVLVDATKPWVTSVGVPADDTYSAGNNLDFTVNTSENVTVSTLAGTPRLTLSIGGTTRYAAYLSGSGTSALVFRYTVQTGDQDPDGVVLSFTIDANDGTLRDSAGNNLYTTLNMIGTTSGILVDAIIPTITSAGVPAYGTYKADNNLDFTVNTSENVTVDTAAGTPRLTLTIGGATRYAVYLSGSGTSALVFRYTVQTGDQDPDGIVLSSTLDANGGILRDSAGNNLNTTLNIIGTTSGVLVDAIIPTITSVGVPAYGTYKADNNLDFTVNTSESVTVNTVAGTPRLTLTIGGTIRHAAYLSGSGTSALVFRHTVEIEDQDLDGITLSSTIDPNGGTLLDSAGNDLNMNMNSIDSLGAVLVDGKSPTAISIMILNASMKVGDVVTATITVTSDTDDYSIGVGGVRGTIDGFDLSGLSKINDTTYTATFLVANGGTDMAAGSDIPVSVSIADSSGNTSNLYTTAISQGGDSIDANIPVVSDVSIPNAAMKVGDAVMISVTAGETGLSLDGGYINGIAVTGFTDYGDNTYSTIYTIVDGGINRAAGDTIPVSFVLTDAAGNSSFAYTTAIDQNADSIDANIPTVTSVSVPVNDTYPRGANLDFTVNLSENITVDIGSGIPRLILTVGTTPRYADYYSGSGTSSLFFRYTIHDGEQDLNGIALASTIDPNSATLRDAGDNDLNTTLNSIGSLTSVLVDANAPTVAEVTPVATPTNDSTPDFTFSSTEEGTLTVGGSCGSGEEGAVTAGNTTITLTQPDNSSALAEGTYSDCTLRVTDIDGNFNDALILSNFMVDLTPSTLDTNNGKNLDEGDTGVAVVSADLHAGDTTSGAATVSYTLITAPASGSLRNNGVELSSGSTFSQGAIDSNRLTYDHDGSETIGDVFTFTLADEAGNVNNNGGDNFTFNFTIGEVNDSPVAVADTATADEDNAVAIDVLANDSDSDGIVDPTTVFVSITPAFGITTVDSGTGLITYTPTTDFCGLDSFYYTVDDNLGAASTSVAVNVTVNCVNDPPLAVDDTAITLQAVPISIDVCGNDIDVDDGDAPDPAAIVVVSGAGNGTAVFNGTTNEIDYTPAEDFVGTDIFTYTVNDGNGAVSNEAAVSVSVKDQLMNLPLLRAIIISAEVGAKRNQ